jgi:hypothetical protein
LVGEKAVSRFLGPALLRGRPKFLAPARYLRPILVLAVVACACAQVCFAQQAPFDVNLEAKEIKREFRNGRELVVASGDVKVTSDGTVFRANSAEWDAEAQRLFLPGRATIESSLPSQMVSRGRRPRGLPEAIRVLITGSDLEYSLQTRSGTVSNASAWVQGLIFRGAQISVQEKGFSVKDGLVTACDLEQPHFALRAKNIRVDPNGKGFAENISLTLGKTTLLRVNRAAINVSGGPGSSGIEIPRLGRSHLSGYYLGWPLSYPLGLNTVLLMEPQLSTKVGFKALATVRRNTAFTPFVRWFYKEELTGRRPKRVLVTRAPEAGFLLEKGALGRPFDILTGEASIGWFKERTTGVNSSRVGLSLFLGEPARPTVGRWRFAVVPGVRAVHYGTGDDYRDLSLALTAARMIGRRDWLKLGFVKHFTAGRTPFVFDEAYLPVELSQELQIYRGNYSFEISTRYDVERRQLFDVRLGLGKVLHCLEPRLVWRGRLRELALEVRVVGLQMGSGAPD